MKAIDETQNLINRWNKVTSMIMSLIFICLILSMNIQNVVTISNIKLNISLGDVFLIPAMLSVLYLVLKQGWKVVFPYWWSYIFLIISISLSAYLAYQSPTINTNGLIGYVSEIMKALTCICYFYLGYNVLKSIESKWFVRLYTIGLTFFIAYGLIANWALAHDVYEHVFNHKHRNFFIGTYKDPNQAATYLIISIYVLILGINTELNKRVTISYILLCGLSVVAIILTDSRGGIIALFVSLCIYLIMNGWQRKKYILTRLLFLLILFLVILLLDMFLTEGYVTSRLFSSINSFERGLDIRKILAETALLMGNNNPLFGIGRGNFALNSATYLGNSTYNVKNLVPHNTYLGLYAEVGIIGVLFYSTPIILIGKLISTKLIKVKGWYHERSNYLGIIVAMGIGVGIQAMVLNLENRRTIWFIMGWIMWTLTKGSYPIKQKYKNNVSYNRRETMLLVISLMTTIVLYGASVSHISYTQSWQYEEDYYQYVIPMESGEVDRQYTLEYKLHARQKNLKGNMIEVSIIEECDGSIYLLNRQTYQQVSGTAKLTFIKKYEESRVYLTAKKVNKDLKEYRIQPVRYYNDSKSIRLDKVYGLAPEGFRDWLALLFPEQKKYKDRYQNSITSHELVVYEDEVILQSVEVSQRGQDKYINMTYLCKQKVDLDYTIWFYGIPDDMHLIPSNKWAWAHEYYSPTEKFETSLWQPGQVYTISYKFPRNIGWYKMRTGIYKIENGKKVRLIDNETGKNYVELGWFNANED